MYSTKLEKYQEIIIDLAQQQDSWKGLKDNGDSNLISMWKSELCS